MGRKTKGKSELKKNSKIYQECFKHFQNKYENLFIENKKLVNENYLLKKSKVEQKKLDIENDNSALIKLKSENFLNNKKLQISEKNIEELTNFVNKKNEFLNQENTQSSENLSEITIFQQVLQLLEKFQMIKTFQEK